MQRTIFILLFPLICPLLPMAGWSAELEGAPWTRHVIDQSSRGADGVRLADVNGNGLPDIATGWEEGGVVRVCLNPGPAKAREPWPGVTVGHVRSPEDAVLVDLDGDGAMDVVSSCEGKTRAMFVHWAPKDPAQYLNPAAWQTAPIPASTNAMMWMFCLPMQVDGKHGVDLVAGGKGPGAQIGWFEAPPNPRQLADWKWHPLRPAGWLMSLVAADMNGNGLLDIVFSDRKGNRTGCFWLENPGTNGDPRKPWKEHLIGAAGEQVLFLTLADLDQDGLQDVIVAIHGGDLLYLRRQSATANAWQPITISVPKETVGGPKAVSVADLNGDGRMDIVMTCEGATPPKAGVIWLAYEGRIEENRWRARTIAGPEGIKYDLVELLDVDGDGDLDVITCEERDNLGLIWYEQPGAPAARARKK